jgi:hypothetical protein
VLVPKDDEVPFTEQITLGQNSENVDVPQGHYANTTVLYETPGILEFTNIDDGVDYRVYMSATDDLPGSPNLMNDDDVRQANVTLVELIEPGVLVLKQDSAAALAAVALAFLF